MWNTGFGLTLSGAKPRADLTRIITGEQNYTKIAGKHQLEFGGRYRQEVLDVLPDQQVGQGLHFFAGGATSLYDPSSGTSYNAMPRTGHDSAAFYLGIAGQYSVRFNRDWWYFRHKEYAGYFQDNWKIRPSLTLNLGVRYEYFSPVTERDNVLSGFDPATKAMITAEPLDKLIRMGYTTQSIINAFQNIGVKFDLSAESETATAVAAPVVRRPAALQIRREIPAAVELAVSSPAAPVPTIRVTAELVDELRQSEPLIRALMDDFGATIVKIEAPEN
jgi:hypothetical protein